MGGIDTGNAQSSTFGNSTFVNDIQVEREEEKSIETSEILDLDQRRVETEEDVKETNNDLQSISLMSESGSEPNSEPGSKQEEITSLSDVSSDLENKVITPVPVMMQNLETSTIIHQEACTHDPNTIEAHANPLISIGPEDSSPIPYTSASSTKEVEMLFERNEDEATVILTTKISPSDSNGILQQETVREHLPSVPPILPVYPYIDSVKPNHLIQATDHSRGFPISTKKPLTKSTSIYLHDIEDVPKRKPSSSTSLSRSGSTTWISKESSLRDDFSLERYDDIKTTDERLLDGDEKDGGEGNMDSGSRNSNRIEKEETTNHSPTTTVIFPNINNKTPIVKISHTSPSPSPSPSPLTSPTRKRSRATPAIPRLPRLIPDELLTNWNEKVSLQTVSCYDSLGVMTDMLVSYLGIKRRARSTENEETESKSELLLYR